MLNFKQHMSEAYTVIPKSEGEIDILKIKMDKDKLKDLFKYVVAKTNMPDPIAIQPNDDKNVKIHRSIADTLDLKSLSSKYGFKITDGNGSRGKTGAHSGGFGFEGQIVKDIEKYIEEGEQGNFSNPDMMKFLHNEILSKHDNIQVKLEGGKNTKRPLIFSDVDAVIGGRDLDVGSKVTDVTIIADDKHYFLSAKYSNTVTFFNAGVATIFTADQFESGKITNKNAKFLLSMFGIDEQRFIDIFVKYDRKNAKKIVPKIKEDVTSKVNLRNLLKLLVTGIGYGYYMIHKKKGKVESYKMDRRRMMDSAKIKKVTVLYPKPGIAKRIDIEVITKLYEFKLNIRNKQGGLYPSHIMCDYKPRGK